MEKVEDHFLDDRIIESKPDHFLDDLLLNSPWPELRSFAETIDLNVADSVVHKHTPYVIILLKVADEWAKTHGGSLPSTREEKKEFKELIRARMRAMDKDNYKEAVEASFKVFAPLGISSNLQRIINDSCADVDSNSFDFWVMVAALKVECRRQCRKTKRIVISSMEHTSRVSFKSLL